MVNHAANSWSQQLGMVATPLFGRERNDPAQSHLALLDGVRASFLLSTDDDDMAPADWAWSANVRHHVLLGQTKIVVSRNSGSADTFERRSVESKLEEFLRYLEIDPGAQKTAGAIDHLIRLFRKHRTTLMERSPDAPHLTSFLYLLAISEREDYVEAHRKGQLVADKYGLGDFDPSVLTHDYVWRFVEEVRLSSASQRRLLTPLTVRHAGGALFQEAHAEVLSKPTQMTLFGLAEAGQQRLALTALGVYYTPPGLARSLTEIALAPHLGRDQITINDPACGSGIFLCEAIRALQRQGYAGRIVLSGCDISESAVQMARFSLASALLDWPNNKIEWKVEVKSFFDSLALDGKFNVILMNPPFRSWESLSEGDRELVRQSLGTTFAGKPDFSTAFVQGSLDHLEEGGTLATLLPRGVLDSQRGRVWRESTLSQADVRFIGTFGDHGLFRHAMVSIGAAVFERRRTSAPTVMIWADERSNSAESALRALRRRLSTSNAIEERSDNWSIYSIKNPDLIARKSWLPTPNALGSLLDVIRESNFPQVRKLFKVTQGIKTGLNEAFLISQIDRERLPKREQRYFRKVVNGDDIYGGQIESNFSMFYAPKVFTSKEELLEAVPVFGKHLLRYEEALKARKSHLDPEKWWEAVRSRKDELAARTPRIMTKMFGALNMAAPDVRGDYLPLQAFAWLPHFRAMNIDRNLESAALLWYCRLLNSSVFFLLRREFEAATTSGGQLDVSQKYVNDVPIPLPNRDDLVALAAVEEPDLAASVENDELVAASYGTPLSMWPVHAATT